MADEENAGSRSPRRWRDLVACPQTQFMIRNLKNIIKKPTNSTEIDLSLVTLLIGAEL